MYAYILYKNLVQLFTSGLNQDYITSLRVEINSVKSVESESGV